MILTSSSNPLIKQIRKLRERKERQLSGLFYIEGLRIVGQAFEKNAGLETLITCPDLLQSSFGSRLIQQCREHGCNHIEVSQKVFESFALKEGPQGIAALVRQHWQPLSLLAPAGNDLWVALDSPQDPGNVGTILRTLDSVGGQGIILLDSATDPYDPAAVRASMGSIFNLQMVKASFDEFAVWKKKTRVPIIGTSGAAEEDYHYFRYPSSLVLLMGSERMGLQPHHLALSDALVKIPMVGSSDSLNLAVSTAITLYEIFNQRRDQPA